MSTQLPDGPIDWSVVGEICGQRPERMLGLLKLFIEDSRTEFDRLHKAWLARDLSAVGEVAHRLRGSSQIMGVASLASLASALEHSGKRGESLEVEGLVSRLADELGAVMQFVAPLIADQA